ncbi:hypothetical protein MAPG_04878 [Magnaporthiopsis poae ATCC 64411]|uniref:Uncharacterized protein n=1 Tax=Magnaporthiopsis poae (strain ATCC 64411 / 73-15) TaxID=644358 RepID=A0A0C4DXX1_MAGP6|nr:hypothetical protein MAPG_04878 [Magnaporthiopsis poae ATCC 64411]
MDTNAHNIRVLYGNGRISEDEAASELQGDWPLLRHAGPGFNAALVVVRALLSGLPSQDYGLTAEAETQVPLLEMAWLRYKHMDMAAKVQIMNRASALPDSFFDLIESEKMRASFWSNQGLGSLFLPEWWRIDAAGTRRIGVMQPSLGDLGSAGLIHMDGIQAVDVGRCVRNHMAILQHGPDERLLRPGNEPRFIRVQYSPGSTDGPGHGQLNKFSVQFVGHDEAEKRSYLKAATHYSLVASVRLQKRQNGSSRDAVRLYKPDGSPVRPPFPTETVDADMVDVVRKDWKVGGAHSDYMLFYTQAEKEINEEHPEAYEVDKEVSDWGMSQSGFYRSLRPGSKPAVVEAPRQPAKRPAGSPKENEPKRAAVGPSAGSVPSSIPSDRGAFGPSQPGRPQRAGTGRGRARPRDNTGVDPAGSTAGSSMGHGRSYFDVGASKRDNASSRGTSAQPYGGRRWQGGHNLASSNTVPRSGGGDRQFGNTADNSAGSSGGRPWPRGHIAASAYDTAAFSGGSDRGLASADVNAADNTAGSRGGRSWPRDHIPPSAENTASSSGRSAQPRGNVGASATENTLPPNLVQGRERRPNDNRRKGFSYGGDSTGTARRRPNDKPWNKGRE